MPSSRGPCKVADYFPDDRCDLKEVTRGLCRGHYEKARRLGKLEMKGTGAKGGRPTGPKLAVPLAEGWEDDPEPSVQELHALVKKLAKRIMLDPGAGQQERVQAMKIAQAFENDEVDEAKAKEFRQMLGQARGLRAVDD